MKESSCSWEPLALDEAVGMMDGFPGRWWIAAGWSIELHVGRRLRDHADVDILVLRDDQEAIRSQLPSWDVQIAHEGRLEPWPDGVRVELPRAGLWTRRDRAGPWQVQFLLAERDGDTWWYRRDRRIRMPLAGVGLRSRTGVPYVRPELTLLFKSRHLRERDEIDFAAALPTLDSTARSRLAAWLPANHPWRNRVAAEIVL